jgi:hypothetical protein
MSQVQGADSQQAVGTTTVVTTTETTAVSTNAVRGPYENCKVSVKAQINITTGTGVTAVVARIRRNASNENVIVQVMNIAAGASTNVTATIMGADAVPDGRDCIYSVTVVQSAATGNGTIQAANIEALVISG